MRNRLTITALLSNNAFFVFVALAGIGSLIFVSVLLLAAKTAPPAQRKVLLFLSLLAPFSSFFIYFFIGSFGAPDAPYSVVQAERESAFAQNQDFALLNALQAKLDRGEGDYRGRVLLAQGFARMNEPEQAKIQYQKAVTESGDKDLNLLGEYAEFLTEINQGRVPPYAEKIFYKVASQNSKDFRAAFYIGLSHLQAGRKQAATQKWRELLKNQPEDSKNRVYTNKIKRLIQKYKLVL